MDKLIETIISFVIVFILIYSYQLFFVIRKCKRNNFKKVSVEVNYLIVKFNLDTKRIDYLSLMKKTSIIAALDIAFVYSFITYFISNIYLCLLFSLLLLIPTIMISYNLLGNYYIKMGFSKEK